MNSKPMNVKDERMASKWNLKFAKKEKPTESCKTFEVTVTQAISLDLKTIEGQPTVYDLPQCSLFGACTAPCKSWEFNINTISYFTLERRVYNSLTTHYITSEVACSYDAGSSRYIDVQKAIESKAILKSNMFFENMSNINKKRNQYLISYEDRYQTKKPKVQQTKIIVNENINHLEEQTPTSENKNKTQNENDNNVNSKSNTLKLAIKKTIKK
ncbi:31187_t:CDS:2 [Gigaspora margarita]|uniref:31187_t:CDS:1 n=1 Tax=Gigaspora margarita TaxID=4874 RepID=A0ABN7VAE8_GIGMA|nr:31187_t:CDS:2 [Gigaspora margarita]